MRFQSTPVFITPKTSHQGKFKQRFQPSFSIILINDCSVSSNHNIDTTTITTRMFGIMFEGGLLFASLLK